MSTSIEAMMQDKRALQSATSHYFGQNFAKAFDIQYLDTANKLQYCETTSWGLSTRMIGAIIMVHGDDQGLVLPPRIAPIQVVLTPIYKNDAEKSTVMEAARRVLVELKTVGVRTKLDDREEVTPGFKFNYWGLRAAAQISPKDVEKSSWHGAARCRGQGEQDLCSAKRAGCGRHATAAGDPVIHAQASNGVSGQQHPRASRLRGTDANCAGWLGLCLVVRSKGMRGKGQGRDKGHYTQCSLGPTHRYRSVHRLWRGCEKRYISPAY
jgi:hypothetical protein